MYMLFLPFVMSVMISYLMTPVAIRVAHAVGAIDVPKVQELAADILEGGKSAFNQRREKYGFN